MRLAFLLCVAPILLTAQPPADLNRVRVGAIAPEFIAMNAESRPVALSSFRGKNLVLVFYRGSW